MKHKPKLNHGQKVITPLGEMTIDAAQMKVHCIDKNGKRYQFEWGEIQLDSENNIEWTNKFDELKKNVNQNENSEK